jgi:hypothetical protein
VSRIPSDRVMSVGIALTGFGVAGSLAVLGWMAAGTKDSFWSWHGWMAISLLALGVLLVVVGLLGPSKGEAKQPPQQRQSGGPGSRNYQAGGDMTIGRDDG